MDEAGCVTVQDLSADLPAPGCLVLGSRRPFSSYERLVVGHAVVDVAAEGLVALEWVDGLTFDELSRLCGAPLRRPA